MKIARIAYANTEPFFHFWPKNDLFELHSGVPKELADAAHRGEVIAGPLPLVACWALEDRFMPLRNWGIAAREKCRSVFVLSRQPFSELDQVTIGVTKESSASVVLCETLVRKKYGNDVALRPGLQLEDAAWLVIGDQALQLSANPVLSAWSIVTDLATEWWTWTQKPFVFARWVVRRDVGTHVRDELSRALDASLAKGMESLPMIAAHLAAPLNLTPEFLTTYLRGFLYELDETAAESERMFRGLVQETGDLVAMHAK